MFLLPGSVHFLRFFFLLICLAEMNYTEYEHSSALSWSPALRLSGSQPQKDTRQAAQLDGSFPLPLGLNRGGG